MSQYWNPAFLGELSRPEVGAMHAMWLGDLKFEWLGYAHPLGTKLGVGSISLAYFHLPSINGVDQLDNPTGQFRVYDLALTAGIARPIVRGVSIGANVKVIRQNLADVSGTGGAVDLGAKATLLGTTIGASVQSLGPDLRLGGSAYPLPRQIRFGASRAVYKDRVLLAADYNIPRDYYKDVRFGTEIRPLDMVSVRCGYRKELGESGDPATGISLGLGLHVKQLSVDYAMTPSNAFDDVHRISCGYTFGGSGEPAPEPKKPEEEKPAPPPPPPPAGPKVIAAVEAPKASATQEVIPPAKTPAPAQTPAPTAPKPAISRSAQYDVVLGVYQSEEGARSEIKALEILGFSVKDARITPSAGGGFRLSLARFGSKKSADDLAASLSRMSFQPRVEVVKR